MMIISAGTGGKVKVLATLVRVFLVMLPAYALACATRPTAEIRNERAMEVEVRGFHEMIDNDQPTQAIKDALRKRPELINAFHPEDGYTALIRASRSGKASMVRLLLRHGADPLQQEAGGMRAIGAHKAAFFAHIDVLKVMAEELSDETMRAVLEFQGPKNGKTVLMDTLWISRPGLPEDYQVTEEQIPLYLKTAEFVIELSRRTGANLNLADHGAQTAKDMMLENQLRFPEYGALLQKLRN